MIGRDLGKTFGKFESGVSNGRTFIYCNLSVWCYVCLFSNV